MAERNWSKIGDGGTAEIFLEESGRVVKLFREWFRKEGADYEYRKSVWAYEQGLPTAEPLGRERYDGREAILLNKIEGESLLQRLQREPHTAAEAAKKFAAYQVRLNSREASTLGDSQRERLVQRLARVEQLNEEERAAVRAELEQLPDDERLCHGDFHPGNIMENEQGWQVIDWIDATCGHPLYDVARTLLLLGFGTEAGGPRGSMEEAAEVFRGTYLQTYLELTGFEKSDVERWTVPVAAIRLTEPIPESEKEKLLGFIRTRIAIPHKHNEAVTIRSASVADLDRLVPLFDAYRVFYEQPSDLEGAERFLAERLGQLQSVVLLAEDTATGRAAGFTQLYPVFSSVSMQRSWILNDLYVDSKFRGSGVGSALLDAAARHARLTGAKGIALSTAPTNKTAQRLYESKGYKPDGDYLNYFLTLPSR